MREEVGRGKKGWWEEKTNGIGGGKEDKRKQGDKEGDRENERKAGR